MKCSICNSQDIWKYCEIDLSISSNAQILPYHSQTIFCNSCLNASKIRCSQDLSDIESVYNSPNYILHEYNGYTETKVAFDKYPGGKRKSDYILEYITKHIPSKKLHSVLDIGCHYGSFLKGIKRHWPEIECHGIDVSPKYEQFLNASGVKYHLGIYPERSFDLICYSHSLEHIPNPVQSLMDSVSHLSKNGFLFIQLNQFENHPFQPLLYEQHSNFTSEGIVNILHSLDMKIEHFSTNWISKEISLIATLGSNENAYKRVKVDIIKQCEENALFLNECQHGLDNVANVKEKFGIFGTSIAGIWAKAKLGEVVDCFADENTELIGQMRLNTPIYHPNELTNGKKILLPFPKDQAFQIKSRLSRISGADFIEPPFTIF